MEMKLTIRRVPTVGSNYQEDTDKLLLQGGSKVDCIFMFLYATICAHISSRFFLTKLQWQHSQMDAGSVICEEAWYDFVGILQSTDSRDDLDNDFASVSRDPLPDVAGGVNAQQASPCKDAACLLDTVQLLRSIANPEACEGEPPEKSDDSNTATTSTNGSSCKTEECCSSGLKELQSTVPCSHWP